MRFITFGYLIFFLVVFIIYWLLPQKNNKYKLIFLAISSSIFYASWSMIFFFHFAFLIFLNYIFSEILIKNKSKFLFLFAIFINVLNLAFFKYFYLILDFLFKITNSYIFKKEFFNQLLKENFNVDSIFLPLAISFYTFQMLAYIIDIWNDKIERRNSFLEFYVFILFFPQLVAGPIMRYKDFFYQFDKKIQLQKEHIIRGFYFIYMGIIKKVIIADNVANIIDPVFQNPSQYSGWANFIATLGYAIRVYGDFSGYTDIARGSAYLLGFHIPENFYGPFLSPTISDFWKNWHFTLSSWLRDYIYIPLGGSRVSSLRNSVNLIITFTLGGLWHGANYTYIVWGLLNGVVLTLERPFLKYWKEKIQQNRVLYSLGVTYTFGSFLLGICFFNAPDIEHSFTMLKQIFSFSQGNEIHKDSLIKIFSYAILVFGFNYIQIIKENLKISEKRDYFVLYILGMLTIWLLANYSPKTQRFIYFQF